MNEIENKLIEQANNKEGAHKDTQKETTIATPSNGGTAMTSTENSPSTTVTSSSPTQPPFFSGQEYQQQLHEAMLVLDSHGLNHLMAAAAAAMGAPSIYHQRQQPQSQQQSSQPSDADLAKRESIRAANRERKKKWRIHNEERNKDNDLRCRVNKRASKLYGKEDSETKRCWAEEEFQRRRGKRQEKERRKDVVNNALNVSQTMTLQQNAVDELARSLTAYPSVFDASKILEIPPDLQRHLLEQLNLALTNSKLPSTDYHRHGDMMAASAQPSSHQQPVSNDTSTTTPALQATSESSPSPLSTDASSGIESDSTTVEQLVVGMDKKENINPKQEYPMDVVMESVQTNPDELG